MATVNDINGNKISVGELIAEIGFQGRAQLLPYKIVMIEFGQVYLAKYTPGASKREPNPFEAQSKVYEGDYVAHHSVAVSDFKCIRFADLAKYNER